MKREYNYIIHTDIAREFVFVLPTIYNVFVRHCTTCDTFNEPDMFQEWLNILRAGSTVQVPISIPHLDIKHVTANLLCFECQTDTVTQVIFEWTYDNDPKT